MIRDVGLNDLIEFRGILRKTERRETKGGKENGSAHDPV
jgi:hypothetical protein